MCKLKRKVETIVKIFNRRYLFFIELKQVRGVQKCIMTFEKFRKAKETARKTTLASSSSSRAKKNRVC